MCRYCNKLREINNLREKNLTDCIKKWKRRDKEARALINWLMFELIEPSSESFRLALLAKADEFVNTNWIGD